MNLYKILVYMVFPGVILMQYVSGIDAFLKNAPRDPGGMPGATSIDLFGTHLENLSFFSLKILS